MSPKHHLLVLLVRVREESGQSTAEYGLLAVLVSIVAMVLLSVIGVDVAEMFDPIEDLLGDDTAGQDGTDVPRDDDADESTTAG